MIKYYLVYFVNSTEVSGVNSTQIKLNFRITPKNLSRVELKLKKALNAIKVTILRYQELEN